MKAKKIILHITKKKEGRISIRVADYTTEKERKADTQNSSAEGKKNSKKNQTRERRYNILRWRSIQMCGKKSFHSHTLLEGVHWRKQKDPMS